MKNSPEQYKTLLDHLQKKLIKALKHLQYSYKKVLSYSADVDELDEETLETWESFCARFSRVVDIYLTGYVKAYVRYNDPGFEGSLRDFVNQAEKLGLLEDARDWMVMRELRNITAHEYTDKDLTQFLIQIREKCQKVLAIEKMLTKS